ncbi:carbohydrate kinase [Thiohalophilus sp.]|uniref:carbohydrate kinase family protein n=1 Tax=Thiohalophilus sp. TaxID=3028392 RepID=UPI002ACD64EE|nr:carbohydrate kinase [Thiohalophilus sp.]MDZ7662666.1 carbohydrate kinase [Thiohalophilus sp.]
MTRLSGSRRPVIFGEVLFDLFSDGTAVLGGAPFNVAWHLQGLGLSPLFISRVGQDKLGDRILQAMDEWTMDTSAVFQDPDHPTGRVQVSLQDGQPSFDIVQDVAYDHIEAAMVRRLYANSAYAMLYHGSLIYRMPTSAQSLSLLRQMTPSIFVDINLRAPWWSKEKIDELLQGINWLKLNETELQTLTGGSIDENQLIEQSARAILEKYNLQALIVTRGAEGAMLMTAGKSLNVAPVEVNRLVDTVGAGDGFSAIWLAGLLRGWSYELTLQRAVEFSAAICQLRGAVSQDKEFYHYYHYHWML